MSKKKVGRPKKPTTPIIKPDLSSFRNDITVFKGVLYDAINDEEYLDNKETIIKFFKLPVYALNIFIVYLLKDVTITELANILKCDRIDLYRIITKTKLILKK